MERRRSSASSRSRIRRLGFTSACHGRPTSFCKEAMELDQCRARRGVPALNRLLGRGRPVRKIDDPRSSWSWASCDSTIRVGRRCGRNTCQRYRLRQQRLGWSRLKSYAMSSFSMSGTVGLPDSVPNPASSLRIRLMATRWWKVETLPLPDGGSFATPEAIAFASAMHGVIVGSAGNSRPDGVRDVGWRDDVAPRNVPVERRQSRRCDLSSVYATKEGTDAT